MGPLHVGLTAYVLYQEIEWSAFVAAGLLILQIPIQMLLTRLFTKLRLVLILATMPCWIICIVHRSKAAVKTDQRVKVMNEVISGIRVIKMYAWEYAFRDVVQILRQYVCWIHVIFMLWYYFVNFYRNEVKIVLKAYIIRAIHLAYFAFSLPLIMFIIFSVYVSFIGDLTPRKVFVTLSLITYLRLTSVHFFILSTLNISEARVAWKRIKVIIITIIVSLLVHIIYNNNCHVCHLHGINYL